MYHKSISNIAWDNSDCESVFEILKDNDFEYIEVAPLELIDNWDNINYSKLSEFQRLLKVYDLKVCSMQSIFYGKNLNIYNNFDACVSHLNQVRSICKIVKCNYIVFGAPSTRCYPHLVTEEQATNTVIDFLSICEDDIYIGIEAIPKSYNTNFCNNYLQVQNLIEKAQMKNLKIHFDIACSLEYGIEKSISVIDKSLVSNIHISHPNLTPLSGTEGFIDLLSRNNMLKNKFVSIEMKKTTMKNIKNAIRIFV